VRRFLAAAGVAAAAYVAGRRHQAPVPVAAGVGSFGALSEIDRRLSELERTAEAAQVPPPRAAVRAERLDKPYTVFHYETLANQVAHERQIAELHGRLREVEGGERGARVLRLADRSERTVGGRRHG
jgi:hypothetical protein